MILEFIEELDIGSPSNHRMVFEVKVDGNLIDCKNISRIFSLKEPVIFPFFLVKKGENVVLYFSNGKQKTEKFVDGICHFFYLDLN